MESSFIELPNFDDVKVLGRRVQAEVDKRRPLTGAPVASIFAAQCINYFVAYSFAAALFFFALKAVPGLDGLRIVSAGSSFWLGAGALVLVFYFLSRILFWLYLGTSLGEYCLGVSSGSRSRLPINAIVWESLHFVCPALWLFEVGCRALALRVGVPYAYGYRPD